MAARSVRGSSGRPGGVLGAAGGDVAEERDVQVRVRWAAAWILPSRHGWGLLTVAGMLGAAWWLLRLDLLICLALLLLAPVLVSLAVVWCLALVATAPRPWLRLHLHAFPQVGQRLLVSARAGWRLPSFLPAWILWRLGGRGGGTALTPLDREGTVLGLDVLGRGPTVVEAARLDLREPLGLARASLPLEGEAAVLVLPRPELPGWARPLPRAVRRGDGRVGAGDEDRLGSLRDYRPGDALASVHWKQSARTDHLLVTEQEPESHLHARLALVAGPGAGAWPQGAEAAISLAAGIVTDWSATQHLGVELSVVLGGTREQAQDAALSPGDPGAASRARYRVVRWSAEAGEGRRLLRALAVLDPSRCDGRASLSPPGAWEEPDAAAWASRPLGADVVITLAPGGSPHADAGRGGRDSDGTDSTDSTDNADDSGGSGSGADTGRYPLPDLDPAAYGTLIVVGRRGAPQGEGPEAGQDRASGHDQEWGAVPLTWRVLTVDATSGEGAR